jgi:hypothetical protein
VVVEDDDVDLVFQSTVSSPERARSLQTGCIPASARHILCFPDVSALRQLVSILVQVYHLTVEWRNESGKVQAAHSTEWAASILGLEGKTWLFR